MTSGAEGALAAFPVADTGVSADGIPFLAIEAESLVETVTRLRDELGYVRFIDVTAVDHPDEVRRFELQYLLYSMVEHRWLRLKVRTNDTVPSVTPLFVGADWFERELFDLFGIRFEGHPNLIRIMMPDEWDGYPLRRDVPIGGEPVDFTVTRDVYGTGDRRG